MRELASIRKDINSVDSAIRELFLLRMSLAHEVAETKAQSDDKIYKPDREAEIIEQRSAGMEEEVRLKYIALLQSMIRASREYQYSEILRLNPEKFPFHPSSEMLKPKTVFYQGVPGAYQELAARALFPECDPVNVPTWEEVFQSVRDGKADVGVVPVENTTAGTVSAVYDLLRTLPDGVRAACHLDGFLAAVKEILPLAELGLGWVCPALLGLAIGLGIHCFRGKKHGGK